MIALGTVFARAIRATVQTVFAVRTGMLAGQTDVSGTAHIITTDMVARFIAVDNVRTFFFAAQTVETLRAWFRAIVPSPALVTDAFARLGVAG